MAEKKPVISIVVPVLNEEALLAGCLRSLQGQDYTGHYEIIIVDNGSTDRSVSIAQEYGVRVLYSPIKRNVFTAREYGARATRGDIVVQADADTIYPRDWLTRITRHFSCHPEAVAVAGTFKYRAPTNWARAEYFLRHLAAIFTIIIFGRPFLVSGANFAFRKRAFVQVNGYDLNLFAPDQYGIVTQLRKAGKILYDRKLSVATSSRRRADKSLPRLTGDVLRNFSFGIARLLKDYVKHSLKRTPETRARRWSRRRLLPTLASTIVFLMISLITYGYFLPSSQVFGKVYYKGDTTHKIVALTFDDGPNEPYTSQILDILANHEIKATFFTTGYNVELYPESARRIVNDGHVLGNHSYSHSANHALTEYGCRDIELAQEAIFEVIGVTPHLYRPPHGKKSPWELQYLKQKNLVEITWNVSTNDQDGKSAESLAADIVKKTKPGSIILLHDGYGNFHSSPQADRSTTVEALPLIIAHLWEQGYEFVTIPDLLGESTYD